MSDNQGCRVGVNDKVNRLHSPAGPNMKSDIEMHTDTTTYKTCNKLTRLNSHCETGVSKDEEAEVISDSVILQLNFYLSLRST